jgi:hypothetical protein
VTTAIGVPVFPPENLNRQLKEGGTVDNREQKSNGSCEVSAWSERYYRRTKVENGLEVHGQLRAD